MSDETREEKTVDVPASRSQYRRLAATTDPEATLKQAIRAFRDRDDSYGDAELTQRIASAALTWLWAVEHTAPAQPGEGLEDAYAAWRADRDPDPGPVERIAYDAFRAGYLSRPASSPSARQGEPSDETVEKMARALIVHLMKDESANGLVVPVGINWRAAMRAALAAWGEGE